MSFLRRPKLSLKKHVKHLKQVQRDLDKELKTAIKELKQWQLGKKKLKTTIVILPYPFNNEKGLELAKRILKNPKNK